MEKSKVAKSRSMSSAPSGHNHEDWNCNMVKPLRFNKCGFNVFSKVSSKRFIEGVPIYLNVYDLTPMNGYVYWAGLGIFHSGVEVHGVEYAFGAHDYPTSGVFEVEPRQCPGFTFRKSVFIGSTTLSPAELREFIEQHAGNYNGDTYHLIAKNCNHFCNDICSRLTGNSIPGWVNRLAKIGSLCNCLLPEGLHVSAVRHQPDYQAYEGEKKRLRSSFCRLSGSLSAMSTKQRQLSVSSVFLTSPMRGSVLPWELKGSVKE
ncbi:hypothetical protein KI387_022522, partial [Taxus chinensis]